MKLSKRFLFVPIVLAIFSYLFYSAYKEVKDKTLNEFNFQQFALADQASIGIENFFSYYQVEITGLSKLSFIADLNDQGKELLAGFYLDHSDQIEAISVIDSKGILIYTFPYDKTVIGKDISNQEHVKTVLQTKKPTISDVFTSVQGFTAIAYHIPIISGNEYKGSIAILIPLDKIGKQFVGNIKTGVTGYGCLISENGIELFDPKTGHTGKSITETFNKNQSVLDLFNKTLTEKKGTTICQVKDSAKVHEGAKKSFASYFRVTLGNTFWTILIFTPEKEVFATLTSFRNHLIILFSLILIVITTYFYFALKASAILKEEKKRKAVENVLRESEKRFRTIFELSPSGISLIDENGSIIEVNSTFCTTLGYSSKELITKNIKLLYTPDKEVDIEKNITKILSGKTLKHEVTNIRKDGTTCEIALYETMIILPDGKPGILSVSIDITERKKVHQELIYAKEKAEESDRLKSAFLANMSHELRTPLNAIIGFSNIMVDDARDEDLMSNSRIILNSGQHLLSLVEDIFDTAMIETGQIKINLEIVDIISVLNEVRDIIYGESLREKKNRIELILNLNTAADHKYILTDSRKIKQVLINLLRNALKFTDEGYIEFGFYGINDAGKNYLKFYVKDTGIGIDRKHHDIIFNKFRQIDDTHTRKFGGMGIGLSIAKKIVELLGGEIWVESEPGKGSVFFFTVPFSNEDIQNENKTSTAGRLKENDYSGKTILIAEDEPTSYELFRLIFTKLNIKVIWAKNGIEVVNLCENNPSISLVLMDIKMPSLNGYEATKRIKNKRPDLPVIAQTAYATLDDKEEALNSGCDAYLSKPIQIKQLMEIIKKYLSS